MIDLNDLSVINPGGGQADAIEGGIRIRAFAETDLFTNPDGSAPIANAPGLALSVKEPVFSLSARVAVDFAATFDAGSLIARTQAGHWAKLAFELSPLARPSIVTVVTRETSDDANGEELAASSTWLRIHRRHDIFALHWSSDGEFWKLARVLALPTGEAPVAFLLSAQSPTGAGCTARFTDIRTSTAKIDDLRNGA